MFVDMREIIRHEIAPHGVDRVGRAQCFGKCALHEPHDAVAYETTVVLVTVLRQSAQRQHGVATDGQIADRVEQRAVEVEAALKEVTGSEVHVEYKDGKGSLKIDFYSDDMLQKFVSLLGMYDPEG